MRNINLPDWVLKHKISGTEVRTREGRYYLYQITSKWDPIKKRSQKITVKYLGRITREGVVAANHERVAEQLKHITLKEYGVEWFLMHVGEDITDLVKKTYPENWESILVFAIMRLAHTSPLKMVRDHYVNSYVSELLRDARTSPASLSGLLKEVGGHRGRMLDFLLHYTGASNCVVVDGTHIFSQSDGVAAATLGFNSKRDFNPQVRMIFIHSLDQRRPVFFRLLSGSVPDVSAIALTIEEAGIEDAVLVGDKGCYSAVNAKELDKHDIAFILPLKRNSTLIDYTTLDENAPHFLFNKRAVCCREYQRKGRRIITYLDESLKAKEKSDFLQRIERGKATTQQFKAKQHAMGTITVATTHNAPPKEIYELLKCRNEVETVINTFKNTLHADRTYMRSDHHLRGWMMINFIALLLHYKTLNLLREKKLLNTHSPKNLLTHLSHIHKLKIGNQWKLAEIPKKTKTILEKLQLPIT